MMKNLAGLFRRYRENEDGTTAVEFGLVAIGFITLLFGIIETGRLLLTWNTFQYAFENASRTALVDADITAAEIQSQISAQLNSFLISSDNVDVDVTFSNSAGINFVEIDGTYTYQSIVPLLPANWETFQINAHSRQPRP